MLNSFLKTPKDTIYLLLRVSALVVTKSISSINIFRLFPRIVRPQKMLYILTVLTDARLAPVLVVKIPIIVED